MGVCKDCRIAVASVKETTVVSDADSRMAGRARLRLDEIELWDCSVWKGSFGVLVCSLRKTNGKRKNWCVHKITLFSTEIVSTLSKVCSIEQVVCFLRNSLREGESPNGLWAWFRQAVKPDPLKIQLGFYGHRLMGLVLLIQRITKLRSASYQFRLFFIVAAQFSIINLSSHAYFIAFHKRLNSLTCKCKSILLCKNNF